MSDTGNEFKERVTYVAELHDLADVEKRKLGAKALAPVNWGDWSDYDGFVHNVD